MLACDVIEADDAEQRRLEGIPVSRHADALLPGAEVALGVERIATEHGGVGPMRARQDEENGSAPVALAVLVLSS